MTAMRSPNLLFCCLIVCFASGCASTKVYEDGRIVLHTQADADGITFRTAKGTYFHADRLKHSDPTLAQGKAASDKFGALAGLATAIGLGAFFQ
jgi:hypothetical protein